MPSPLQKRKSILELNSSNSTSALFAGSVQRPWMDQIPATYGCSPKATKPRSFTLPQSSTKVAPNAGMRTPQLRKTSKDPQDENDDSAPAPLVSPNLDATKNSEKRPRTDDEHLSSESAVDKSNSFKRPRRAIFAEFVEPTSEEATATLPSPPNDRTPLPTHRLPSENAEISSTQRKSLVAETDVPTNHEIAPSQTRSPPSEAASTAMEIDISETAIREELPTSSVDQIPSKVTSNSSDIPTTTREEITGPSARKAPVAEMSNSSNNPLSSDVTSQPDNRNQAEHHDTNLFPTIKSPYFKTSYNEVTTRLNLVQAQTRPSPHELARLRLLQQACSSGDQFFLVLHQLYCNKRRIVEQTRDSTPVRNGIHVLGRMLATNDQFSAESLVWFSDFAISSSSAEQEQVESKVWRFLASFHEPWSRLCSAYPPFKSPPSSWAMQIYIPGLNSVVLQQVIFRANLRTSWVGPHDACIDLCESVFGHEQQLVQTLLRDRRPDDPSFLLNINWLDKMATREFTEILAGHHAHGDELHNTLAEVEHSQELRRLSRAAPEEAQLLRRQHPGGTETPASQRPRPSLPNLNTNHGQPVRGTIPSPSPTSGPYSAPFSAHHRSHPVLPSSSPSTPTIASNRTIPQPSPVTQSHQTRVPGVPVVTAASSPFGRHAQLPMATQTAFSPSIAANQNIIQAQMGRGLAGAPTAAQGRQEVRMQPPAQVMQVRPGAQILHPQQLAPTQQVMQRTHIGTQPVYVTQSGQAAMIRQDLPRQQHAQMQDLDGLSMRSTMASAGARRMTIPVQLPDGRIQHMPVLIDAGSPMYHQQANGSPMYQHPANGPPVYQHQANGSIVVPQGTRMSIPNNQFQAIAPTPEATREHVIRNIAAPVPQAANPNATPLDQAQVQAPQVPQDQPTSFNYVQQVLFLGALQLQNKSTQSTERVSNYVIDRLPKEVMGATGVPIRLIAPGDYLARIACIKIRNSEAFPPLSRWATSDVAWPPSIKVSVNGRTIDIRRKAQFGKDLAVDVTCMLKLGDNQFKASVLHFPPGDDMKWLIGLEIICVVATNHIKRMVTTLDEPHCNQRILDKLRSKDLDVEVVDPQTVLDLTDPFTSRIFDIPVRGLHCAHNQCFDLDTFLQTRRTELKTDPTFAEDFRCPICKGDVRPEVMVLDGFLASIRAELEKRGRLDAKAVVLRENGEWEIKEEEKKSKDESDENASDRGPNPSRSSSSTNDRGKGKERATADVIVLDDD